MKSPSIRAASSRSLPNSSLDETSATKNAVSTSASCIPEGHATRYSKNPDPAPLTLDHERAEVAVQHRTGPVFQTHGEHEDGRTLGHGDAQRLERPCHPRMIGHMMRRLGVAALPAEGIPAVQLRPQREAVAQSLA